MCALFMCENLLPSTTFLPSHIRNMRHYLPDTPASDQCSSFKVRDPAAPYFHLYYAHQGTMRPSDHHAIV